MWRASSSQAREAASAAELLRYACCHHGLFTGPFFSLADWHAAMRAPQPVPTRRAFGRALLTALAALAFWRAVAAALPYRLIVAAASADSEAGSAAGGALADKVGGAPVMLGGLLIFSLLLNRLFASRVHRSVLTPSSTTTRPRPPPSGGAPRRRPEARGAAEASRSRRPA